jgi:hypothetical protein
MGIVAVVPDDPPDRSATAVIDSSTPAIFRTAVCSAVEPAPIPVKHCPTAGRGSNTYAETTTSNSPRTIRKA